MTRSQAGMSLVFGRSVKVWPWRRTRLDWPGTPWWRHWFRRASTPPSECQAIRHLNVAPSSA